MSDYQRDPLAELQAAIEAFADAAGRAIRMWVEENRPALEALSRIAEDPRVRAYAEARKRGEIPEPRPCHCLCAKSHPADKGVCEALGAVTARRFTSQLTGPVDVPLCAPCAVAQGIAEMERA